MILRPTLREPAVLLAALALALAGAGACARDQSPTSTDSPPAPARESRAGANEETIALARVDACAGFTVETAAGILGVPVGALAAETGRSEELGGQMCHYWSPDSLIGPGIQFLLEVDGSAEDAAADLASLRENAPEGQAAIAAAMGQAPPDASVIELPGVGDEAIWDALTSSVTLRVANVVARIEVAASSELATGQERAEIELERRVAEEIARGLRTP